MMIMMIRMIMIFQKMKIATQILRYIEVQTIKGIYSNDNKDDNAAFLAITITLAIDMSLLISEIFKN